MGKNGKEINSREITVDEVAKHNNLESLWMIYKDKVLDLTHFLNEHPGGYEILLEVAGQDGTSRFRDIGHSKDAVEMTEQYVIGTLRKDASSGKKTSSGISSDKNCRKCLSANAVIAIVAVGLFVAYRYFRK